MKWLPARPTIYRGIRMRSRLEADFARWLDQGDNDWLIFGEDEPWDYEPVCFGGPEGQYLPDFRVIGATANRYIEVKPTAVLQSGANFSQPLIEEQLQRLEIIWESESDAELHLVVWEYRANVPKAMFYADGWLDRIWHVRLPGLPFESPLIWGGRGQWHTLREARKERQP